MPLLTVLLATAALAGAPEQPNVVLILADDLGWTDLSTGRTCDGNGSPYHRTPHLDALAEAGASFPWSVSCGPNCAPTRASLWSGSWPVRTGIYTVGSGDRGRAADRALAAAPNRTELEPEVVTLAETLRAAGYATGHFGKWHLGDGERGPAAQGFDRARGGDLRGGVGGDGHFADEHGAFPLPELGADGHARRFLADRLTDEALAWMAEARGPFFCCVSHYSVHTPVQAPEDALAATPEPDPEARHHHRTYAAMVANLDANVGRMVDFLARTDDPARAGEKLLAHTLVVFTSDNGGLGGYAAAGIAGGAEITNQLPLRAGKGSLFEGGVRVPTIVRWDGHVVPGTVDPTPVATLDWYPTLAAIAGATLPADLAPDGIDLSPRLRLEPAPLAERPLFWHFPGYLEANAKHGTWRTTPVSVVKRGRWKLRYEYEARAWSLYDLAADPGESHDGAAQHPDVTARLARELVEWLRATDAPLPRDPESGAPVAAPEVPGR